MKLHPNLLSLYTGTSYKCTIILLYIIIIMHNLSVLVTGRRPIVSPEQVITVPLRSTVVFPVDIVEISGKGEVTLNDLETFI